MISAMDKKYSYSFHSQDFFLGEAWPTGPTEDRILWDGNGSEPASLHQLGSLG